MEVLKEWLYRVIGNYVFLDFIMRIYDFYDWEFHLSLELKSWILYNSPSSSRVDEIASINDIYIHKSRLSG